MSGIKRRRPIRYRCHVCGNEREENLVRTKKYCSSICQRIGYHWGALPKDTTINLEFDSLYDLLIQLQNILERNKREKSPEKYLFYSSRSRSKIKGLEHNISIEDIIIPEYCPMLGTKLNLTNYTNKETSPSLDRIDNSKGYIKGNVQVISHKANMMKNSATPEELINFAKWVDDNIKKD